jgi:hypothetical protein
LKTRGRHRRLTPEGAPRVLVQSRTQAALRLQKKNTHRRPSRADGSERFGRPQDLVRALG